MDLSKLIDLIEIGYKENSIVLPKFYFNNEVIKNAEFVKMGYTYDGKTIYQSKECLDKIEVLMEDLISINNTPQYDKGIGECDICREAEKSLDKAVFQVLGKHIQPYNRTYDGHTSSEKIFLPLECEVQGDSTCSGDSDITTSIYPQWKGYKMYPEYRIKHLKYSESKTSSWSWWNANLSTHIGRYCITTSWGVPCVNAFYGRGGLSIAFCV